VRANPWSLPRRALPSARRLEIRTAVQGIIPRGPDACRNGESKLRTESDRIRARIESSMTGSPGQAGRRPTSLVDFHPAFPCSRAFACGSRTCAMSAADERRAYAFSATGVQATRSVRSQTAGASSGRMNRDRVADDTRAGLPRAGRESGHGVLHVDRKNIFAAARGCESSLESGQQKARPRGLSATGRPSDTPPKMIRVYTISVTLQKNEK
jgi:hypothetical protein